MGLFVVWEPTFWYFISRDYTSVFHVIAFATGFAAGRYLLRVQQGAPANQS